MTLETAKSVAKTMPKIRRATVYATWRKRSILPLDQIDLIEKMFPVEQSKPIVFPSFPQMTVNAARAAARTMVRAAFLKPVIRSPEEKERLLEICRHCPSGLFVIRKGKERCSHKKCGCFMALKTRLEGEHCPSDHW